MYYQLRPCASTVCVLCRQPTGGGGECPGAGPPPDDKPAGHIPRVHVHRHPGHQGSDTHTGSPDVPAIGHQDRYLL